MEKQRSRTITNSELEQIEKGISKELKKYDIDYSLLPKRTKELLIETDNFYTDLIDKAKNDLDTFKKDKCNVDEFCEYADIARSTIYKKNSKGKQSYRPVIDYINSKEAKFNQYKNTLMQDYFRKSIVDFDLMDKLLNNQIDIMNMKKELEEKDAYIKQLEHQLYGKYDKKLPESVSTS